MNEVKEFDLPRSLWLRGEEGSCLLRETDNKMCCLGVYLEACGFSRELLLNRVTPHEYLSGEQGQLPSWLINHNINSEATHELMQINDAIIIGSERYEELKEIITLKPRHPFSEEEREEKIVNLFAKNGIIVNIVD